MDRASDRPTAGRPDPWDQKDTVDLSSDERRFCPAALATKSEPAAAGKEEG
jgi:hypothetical protein